MSAGIGRLDLFIVLRNQLGDRALVRRALAVEAAMEELARAAGGDAITWGLAGLGCDIDAKLTAGNLARRGLVAEELLRAEGVAAEAAAAARLWRDAPIDELPPIARALIVAHRLVDLIADALADAGLDELADGRVAHRLRRLIRRGDEPRTAAALEALQLTAEIASEAALRAHGRIREDLNL